MAEGFTQEDVQRMIDAALQKQKEQHDQDLQDLRESLNTNPEIAPVAAHAGGVGTRIHDTWSMHEQELSRAGNHPDQQKKSGSHSRR